MVKSNNLKVDWAENKNLNGNFSLWGDKNKHDLFDYPSRVRSSVISLQYISGRVSAMSTMEDMFQNI